MTLMHTVCPDCGMQFHGIDAEEQYHTHMDREHRSMSQKERDSINQDCLDSNDLPRSRTELKVLDRIKLSRIIAIAQGIDPDYNVMVGFKTMKAWEARLCVADAVIDYVNDSSV